MKKQIIIVIGYLFFLLISEAMSQIDKYPEKIWLHRCNSLEKLKEMNARYPNVEIDIVFREDHRLDVTHDIDKTFNLTAEPYFANMKQNGGKLWMDIKNLNAENLMAFFNELERLRETYGISQDRLIIESPCREALAYLTERGYYTSYYVSYEKPSKLTRTEIEQIIDSLRFVVDTKGTKALSFPAWWYDDIKEKLNRPIDLLTWKHRTTQFEFFITPTHCKLLEDKQLKVILIKDKGRYHR